METKKQHKSEIKIVIYFKNRKEGAAYTDEDKAKSFNRKEQYFYTYFPKKGGGFVTNHEQAFDNAHNKISEQINYKNVHKAMIFLCNLKTGAEERAANYVDGIGWQFFHRPEFNTTAAGHRYISRYQSLPIFNKIAA